LCLIFRVAPAMFTSIVVASSVLATAHRPFEQWAAERGINSQGHSMRRNYEANCREMDRLDREHPGATFQVNDFSGMTYEEFSEQYLIAIPEPHDSNLSVSTRSTVAAGDSLSWPISGIRSQSCGSCWVFASMAHIEQGAIHLGASQAISLAEKEILDCSGRGCGGGRAEMAFRAVAGKEIYTEASCRWTGVPTGDCNSCHGAVPSMITISGYHRAPLGGDAGLLQEIQHDSVVVAVQASQAFMHGWTGIDSNPDTSCDTNHYVLVFGYDFRGPVPYWQIKNSWGSQWAEGGTARIKRTSEGCGPYGMFQGYLVQADGISIVGPIPPMTTTTTPVPLPTTTYTFAPIPQDTWCCQDSGCAYDTCFSTDSFCTMAGPEKCVNNCGGTWCPMTPAPPPPPAPGSKCCQDSGCAADTCFPEGSFCTMSGPEKCVQNCGGTWCAPPSPEPTPAPAPTTTAAPTPAPPLPPAGTEWCCQDPGCAVGTCFGEESFCTQAGADKCVKNCGGTWCTFALV